MHVAESQSISCFVHMVFSNVIVDVTIPLRSFLFGQSRAKVSAGFTNVSKCYKHIDINSPCTVEFLSSVTL